VPAAAAAADGSRGGRLRLGDKALAEIKTAPRAARWKQFKVLLDTYFTSRRSAVSSWRATAGGHRPERAEFTQLFESWWCSPMLRAPQYPARTFKIDKVVKGQPDRATPSFTVRSGGRPRRRAEWAQRNAATTARHVKIKGQHGADLSRRVRLVIRTMRHRRRPQRALRKRSPGERS